MQHSQNPSNNNSIKPVLSRTTSIQIRNIQSDSKADRKVGFSKALTHRDREQTDDRHTDKGREFQSVQEYHREVTSPAHTGRSGNPISLIKHFMETEFKVGGFAEKSIQARKKVNQLLEARNAFKQQQYIQKFCKLPLEPKELPVEELENKQVIGSHINNLKEMVDKVNFLDKIVKNRKDKREDIELDKKKHKAFFSTLQGLQMFGGGDFGGGPVASAVELEVKEQPDPFSMMMGQAFSKTAFGDEPLNALQRTTSVIGLDQTREKSPQKRPSFKSNPLMAFTGFSLNPPPESGPTQAFTFPIPEQNPEGLNRLNSMAHKRRPSMQPDPRASQRSILESSQRNISPEDLARQKFAKKLEQAHADEILAVSAGVQQLTYQASKPATAEDIPPLPKESSSPVLDSPNTKQVGKSGRIFNNLHKQSSMQVESSRRIGQSKDSKRQIDNGSDQPMSPEPLGQDPGGLIQRRVLSARYEKVKKAEIFAKIAEKNKLMENEAKESEEQAQARLVNGPVQTTKHKLFNNEHTIFAKKSLCNSIARVLLKEDEVSPPDKFLRLLIEKNQNPELSGITGNLQHIMEGAQIDVLSTKIGKRFKMIQEQTGKLNDHMLEVKQKLSKKAASRASYYDDIERKSKIKADKILSGKYAKILNRPQTGATTMSMSRKDVRGDSASGTGRTHLEFKASFGETDRTNDPSKSMTLPYPGRFGSNTDATQASEQDEDNGEGTRIQDLMFAYRNSFNNQGGADVNPVGIHNFKIPQTNTLIKKPSETKKTKGNYGGGDTSRSSFGVKGENKFKIRALPHSNSTGLRIGTAKVGTSSKDLASTKVPTSPTAGGLADDPIMDASSASLDSLTEIKLDRLYSEAIVLKEKKQVLDRLENHRGSREIINDLVQKRLAEVNAKVERTNWDRLQG